jgi:hypothetical protein
MYIKIPQTPLGSSNKQGFLIRPVGSPHSLSWGAGFSFYKFLTPQPILMHARLEIDFSSRGAILLPGE